MTNVISVENLSKSYRLGQIGTGTLSRDLEIWLAKIRGKPNPYLKIGQTDPSELDGETLWALRDVSFKVEQGEVLGIIGRNGAGKSTLLKILSRVTAPTSGQVKVKGRIASLLEVGTGFHPELTGRENIFLNGAILGMSKQEVQRKFDEIVSFAEVEKFVDTPVKRYSSGMYVRLAFAVAAHLESEILLVDEVLAVGDAEFQKKCLGKMGDVATNEGRTVFFVSHNMAAIRNLCSSGYIFDHGSLIQTDGLDSAIRYYSKTLDKQKKNYGSGPIKSIEVSQKGPIIDIYVNYSLDFEIPYPGLGFVISDYLGNRILGTSAMVDNIQFPKKPSSSGSIIIKIIQPKLYNGTYKLSIWFGDGVRDFFVDKECLEFDVLNMATLRQPNNKLSGSIYPECQWDLIDYV